MEYKIFSDEYFMNEALKEARKAFDKDEVPIGAVVVVNNKIIARAHNLTETLNDATAHAEMQAITSASNYLGSKYLSDATLFVTIEPCPMCAGALFWSKIGRVVYGAKDEKNGFLRVKNLSQNNHLGLLHPKTTLTGGVLAYECAKLMTDFFAVKRK